MPFVRPACDRSVHGKPADTRSTAGRERRPRTSPTSGTSGEAGPEDGVGRFPVLAKDLGLAPVALQAELDATDACEQSRDRETGSRCHRGQTTTMKLAVEGFSAQSANIEQVFAHSEDGTPRVRRLRRVRVDSPSTSGSEQLKSAAHHGRRNSGVVETCTRICTDGCAGRTPARTGLDNGQAAAVQPESLQRRARRCTAVRTPAPSAVAREPCSVSTEPSAWSSPFVICRMAAERASPPTEQSSRFRC